MAQSAYYLLVVQYRRHPRGNTREGIPIDGAAALWYRPSSKTWRLRDTLNVLTRADPDPHSQYEQPRLEYAQQRGISGI